MKSMRMLQPRVVATTATNGRETVLLLPRSDDTSETSETTDTMTAPHPVEWRDRRTFFTQAQWTPDGTTLITTSADQQIRTFIVPPDLLEERQSPHILEPYSTISSPESVYAATIYPGFYLQDPSTTLVLSSIRDHPIRLDSALAPGLVASYPLVNQNTEAFVCPHSLLFTRDGTRFLAGSDSMISVFDVARSGSEPLTQLLTIPSKRSKNLGGGVGMKGIISALGLEPNTSVLAAGTFSGQVGLYSDNGEGDTIGVFSLAGSNAHDTIGGHGVTQVKWSPCGKYLYVVERMSDGVLIYDIRDTGQLLGWLTGRKAMTNERMGVDLHTTSEVGNYDIWAGGTDGSIRVWTDPHQQEGGQEPVSKWNAHDDVVTSSVVHPLGGVVASTSGQHHFDSSSIGTQESDESDIISGDDIETENCLNIWSLQEKT